MTAIIDYSIQEAFDGPGLLTQQDDGKFLMWDGNKRQFSVASIRSPRLMVAGGGGTFEAVGVAAGLIADHVAEANPHTQYLLATDYNPITDHGALSGLTDDDHTQYLLATGARDGASSQAQTFTKGIALPTITADGDGVIYRGVDRFIHNYNPPAQPGRNTFVGIDAGNFTLGGGASDDGSFNTAVGHSVLNLNTTGKYNTVMGATAMAVNTTGKWNTAIGSGSMIEHITGDSNTAIGADTMYNDEGSYGATCVGHFTLFRQTTAQENTAIGFSALGFVTTGSYNTAVGRSAGGNDLVTGSYNVFLGYKAGYNETGSNTLYIDTTNRPAAQALIYGVFDRAAPANQILSFAAKVGINNVSPSERLDVVGNMKITGNSDLLGNLLVGETTTRVGLNVNAAGASASGRISVNGASANHNLILNAKGTGAILFNVDSPTAAVRIESPSKAVASNQFSMSIRSTDAYGIDLGGNLGLGGFVNTGSVADFAGIAGRKENATAGDYGGYFQISTRTMGGNHGVGVRVSSLQYVGIGGITTPTAVLHIAASTTARASLCLPHGVAPTSPVNGDWWSTTVAPFTRINGTTKQIAAGVQATGGAATAGAAYTATEQTMLQAVYDAARAFGLLT